MPWYGIIGMILAYGFGIWALCYVIMYKNGHDETYYGKSIICWIICGVGVVLIVLAYLNYIPAEAETAVCTCCNCIKQ